MLLLSQTSIVVLFALVYFIGDILYVILSKDVYSEGARRIQGSSFPSNRLGSAVLAYGALVGGWAVFVPRLAKDLSLKIRSAFIAGLLAGAAYGFVVYGVFNGTLRVMFYNYTQEIALRDLLWGTTCAAVVTGVYTSVASNHSM